jgi:hypothetical protein
MASLLIVAILTVPCRGAIAVGERTVMAYLPPPITRAAMQLYLQYALL